MNVFGMGPGELVLIMIIALIVFGPGKLPEIAASTGRMIREFRRTTQELTSEFQREFNVNDIINPEPAPPAANGTARADGKPEAAAASTVAYAAPAMPTTPAAGSTVEAASAPAESAPAVSVTAPIAESEERPLATFEPIADESTSIGTTTPTGSPASATIASTPVEAQVATAETTAAPRRHDASYLRGRRPAGTAVAEPVPVATGPAGTTATSAEPASVSSTGAGAQV